MGCQALPYTDLREESAGEEPGYTCVCGCVCVCVCVCLFARLYLTLCNPMDCSPLGSSIHGISQARLLGVGGHLLLQGDLPDPGIKPMSPA